MTFKEENDKLYLDILDRYFFEFWRGKKTSDYKRPLELNLSPYCSLKCKYCYINKFRSKLFPPNAKNALLLKNTEILLRWLIKNNFNVGEIEIFSGDSFTASQIDELYGMVFDYAKIYNIDVVVPINPAFVLEDEKVKTYLKWREIFLKNDLKMHFSLSMDGKYADIARPFTNENVTYTDDFYKRVAELAPLFEFGFHPMIAPENIHVWKENIKWYVDFVQKALEINEERALNSIYLLEVRNPNWTKKRLLYLASFTFYLTKFTFAIYNHNPDLYMNDFIKKEKGVNYYSSVISTVGRGFTCSIQEFITVRVADLAIVPCHRTAWPGFESANLEVKDNQIVNIKPINPWIHLAVLSGRNDNAPFCSHCPINSLCTGFCLGTNLEYNKQPFIPVPNVCRMEFTKYKSIAKSFKMLGIWDVYESFMKKDDCYYNNKKLQQMKYLLEGNNDL